MSNTLLTPTAVTREALRIAHQSSNFISNIDRQHDSDFAVSGAKIGESIKIRQPNQFCLTCGVHGLRKGRFQQALGLTFAEDRLVWRQAQFKAEPPEHLTAHAIDSAKASLPNGCGKVYAAPVKKP